MNDTKQTSSSSSGFGVLSLAGFCFGVLLLLAAGSSARSGGEGLGLDRVREFVLVATVVFTAGLVSAVIGLFKKERPEWIASLGLVLCALPLVLCALGLQMFYRISQH